jgi:hypothetical protein
MSKPVPVSAEDTKAAYSLAQSLTVAESGSQLEAEILAQALANHRVAAMTSALEAARREALEEAAKVAQNYFNSTEDMDARIAASQIKKAIRALASRAADLGHKGG